MRSAIAACSRFFQSGGFILRDAAKWPLLRMRFETLMVRSAASPRVSNHEAIGYAKRNALSLSARRNLIRQTVDPLGL